MPIVQISLIAGRTPEKKELLIKKVTEAIAETLERLLKHLRFRKRGFTSSFKMFPEKILEMEACHSQKLAPDGRWNIRKFLPLRPLIPLSLF
ncbi:MAG: hypothetical protein H6Q41_6079 [Deltaproteobacteria bacterium]|nr:hypothetical protein [Deltaproteobacteria bacterium]